MIAMHSALRVLVLCASLFASAAWAQAAGNYQGLWWASPASSESGWGINFTHQRSPQSPSDVFNDVIFATWFTYDANGRPVWYSSTMRQPTPDVLFFTGEIYKTAGPVFSATPFDPKLVTATIVGNALVTFSNDQLASFKYTVGGVTQIKTITPQVFRSRPSCTFFPQATLAAAVNYQGLWWASPAGVESGWGINFAHQSDVIFATWFTYDVDKEPLWLSATFQKNPDGSFTGDLFRTKGPPFDAVPFSPALVSATKVGTGTLRFTSGLNGTFAYTVNGIAQSKTITQQIFASQATLCVANTLSLFSVSDGFFGGGDTLQSFPYSSNNTVSTTVICSGTGCATVYDVATFKLRAAGRSYTISNLQATGTPVAPLFSGLANGQVIADGQTVTFKLQSPFTRGATVQLIYSFTILETGDTFRYQVQLRTN